MSISSGIALATMFIGLIGMIVTGLDLYNSWKKLKEKK